MNPSGRGSARHDARSVAGVPAEAEPPGAAVVTDAVDRIRIHELIDLHGHLVDEGEFDRFDELFTDDVVHDVTALGGTELVGPQAIAEAGLALGAANPLGHHVTNIVVTEVARDRALARSKAIAVMADGTVGSVVHLDELRRTDRGWRIAVRRVLPRRTPLHPSDAARDAYVAAFAARCVATGLPVLAKPGLHGVVSKTGWPSTRVLVTDDGALDELGALLPAVRGGLITVFVAAARCTQLLREQPGWTPGAATAMASRDLGGVPQLALPPELTLRAVRRRPEDGADGVTLQDAVALAVLAEPDGESSADALAGYLAALSPTFRLLAAVDRAGAVRATTGYGVFGAHAAVIFVNTHPDWRRRGIGLAMTATALRAARDAGAAQASLDASGAGLSIYRRLGFEVVAETLRFAVPD